MAASITSTRGRVRSTMRAISGAAYIGEICTSTLPARALPKWVMQYSGELNSTVAMRSPFETPESSSRCAKRFAAASYSAKSIRLSPAIMAALRGSRCAASRRMSPNLTELCVPILLIIQQYAGPARARPYSCWTAHRRPSKFTVRTTRRNLTWRQMPAGNR